MFPSISNPNLCDKSNIKILLSQEESRGLSAMTKRFQKFKHSQKSLSKKMNALKAKLNDSIEESDEGQRSIDRRKIFKRTSSDSSAMAEILARSVMKATTSLSCILEDPHDTKDDTRDVLLPVEQLIIQAESEEVVSDALSYSSSDNDTSSSDSDYDYRDFSSRNNDIETISSIISNVEKLQRSLSNNKLHKQYSLPAIPTRGFSLNSLDSLTELDDSGETINFNMPLDKKVLEEETANKTNHKPLLSRPKLERHNEIDVPDSLIESENNTETRKLEKVETPVGDGKWKFPSNFSLKSQTHPTHPSILNTALKTMLFERANLLGTPTNENKFNFPEVPADHKVPSSNESKGIVQTALQTMLIERADLLGTESLTSNVSAPECSNYQKPLSLSEPNTATIYSQQHSISDNIDDPRMLASISLEKVNIKPNKMVKTAMQTMLLEKFNMLGTYTPPTSPKLISEEPQSPRPRAFTFNEPRTKVVPKSASSISLGDEEKPKETVLGMPFVSLSSLKSEQERLNLQRSFLSDSQIHQPALEILHEKETAKHRLLKFLHASGKGGNMFHKFRRASKKSLPDDIHKEYHLQNKLLRMFHPKHEDKSLKDEETQTSNQTLTNIKPELFPNSVSKTKICITPPKPPSPTDLASGDFLAHSKTKSACLTLHSSPAQERQDDNTADNKPQHSPESGRRIPHSPVKVNYMVPMHRRSSDSDLSITPKGKY